MLYVESVVFVLFLDLLSRFNFGMNSYLFLKDNSEIMPWVGILRLKIGTYTADAATRLILIEKGLALANANDVAKIKNHTLRTSAKALFYENNVPFHCEISNFILHPEYYKNVLNTIALLNLSCDKDNLTWNPILWPSDSGVPKQALSIGLTDSHQRIHQVSYEVEVVNKSDCDRFYQQEELDYKTLYPSHCICYNTSNVIKQCVMESGMALTTKLGGSWKLIGLSTHGPGCSLPSRFINFFPYITWIQSYLVSRRKQMNFRRTNYEQGMEEPYEDMDTIILSKIKNNTIVMRPSLAYLKEQVYGKCDSIDGVLMYREYGTIKAPEHTAVGVYSVSLYDLFFSKLTCIMVTVMCNKRSITNFWFDTGFHQEDIEDYVKIIPMPHAGRNKTKTSKILFAKDTNSRYRHIKTANLFFKFEFTDEAKMDLEFYGLNESVTTTPLIIGIIPPHLSLLRHLNKSYDEDKEKHRVKNTKNEKSLNEDSFYYF